MADRDYDEALYQQQKGWEAEQEHYASESAIAEADIKAQEEGGMAQQAEIQATRTIKRIVDILEEVRDCGYDMDLIKTAVEIYELSKVDAAIADNMRSYWIEKADGAER